MYSNYPSNLSHKDNEDIASQGEEKSIVSFEAKLPITINAAMQTFIEKYPNWDQYRLIQAALAGFLVQNGMESREIIRLYIANMFSSNSFSRTEAN